MCGIRKTPMPPYIPGQPKECHVYGISLWFKHSDSRGKPHFDAVWLCKLTRFDLYRVSNCPHYTFGFVAIERKDSFEDDENRLLDELRGIIINSELRYPSGPKDGVVKWTIATAHEYAAEAWTDLKPGMVVRADGQLGILNHFTKEKDKYLYSACYCERRASFILSGGFQHTCPGNNKYYKASELEVIHE